jgi:hypothetical protein
MMQVTVLSGGLSADAHAVAVKALENGPAKRLNFRQKKGRGVNHARTTTRRMEEPCGNQLVGAGCQKLDVRELLQIPHHPEICCFPQLHMYIIKH